MKLVKWQDKSLEGEDVGRTECKPCWTQRLVLFKWGSRALKSGRVLPSGLNQQVDWVEVQFEQRKIRDFGMGSKSNVTNEIRIWNMVSRRVGRNEFRHLRRDTDHMSLVYEEGNFPSDWIIVVLYDKWCTNHTRSVHNSIKKTLHPRTNSNKTRVSCVPSLRISLAQPVRRQRNPNFRPSDEVLTW